MRGDFSIDNIVYMFSRKKDSDPVRMFKDVGKVVAAFVAIDKIAMVKMYLIGPIALDNCFKIKELVLKFKPLSSFELYGDDHVTFYHVKTKYEVSVVFLEAITPSFDKKTGFLSLVQDEVADEYLDSLGYFILYKDGYVHHVPGMGEQVNNEWLPVYSEKYL
jgi:hypothetical protein